MTQEDKQLLLQDLCARLPYGVKISKVIDDYVSESALIRSFYPNGSIIIEGEPFDNGMPDTDVWDICEIKPYLRPMSSMTEEEKKEYENCYQSDDTTTVTLLVDFYNKNHFDYRGLIPMGLALEAPEGMYF